MRTPDGQLYGHEEQSVTCILDGSLLSLFCINMPAVDLECRLLVIQEDVCFTCTYVRVHICAWCQNLEEGVRLHGVTGS